MNIFRKIMHSVILTTNFGVVIALVISGSMHFIKPAFSAIPSFLSYAYVPLMIVNCFFIFYWGIRLKPWVFLSIFGIVFTWNTARSWIPFNFPSKEDTSETIKVLTYNVEFFQHPGVKISNGIHPIINYIEHSNADIVCLQEVGPEFVLTHMRDATSRSMLSVYPYFVSGEKENRYSVILLSKYPILNYRRIQYSSQSNSSYYYDIRVGEDTIRLINNHLESNKLNSMEKNQYSDLIRKRESDQITKVAENLSSKVGSATVIRGSQADSVAAVIKDSPFKTLVCGDFNDVPGSYTYRTIRKGLMDAWVERGLGWGNTFNDHLFLFRIDYILYSSAFKCVKFQRDKVVYSDHYPIWANFRIQ